MLSCWHLETSVLSGSMNTLKEQPMFALQVVDRNGWNVLSIALIQSFWQCWCILHMRVGENWQYPKIANGENDEDQA